MSIFQKIKNIFKKKKKQTIESLKECPNDEQEILDLLDKCKKREIYGPKHSAPINVSLTKVKGLEERLDDFFNSNYNNKSFKFYKDISPKLISSLFTRNAFKGTKEDQEKFKEGDESVF